MEGWVDLGYTAMDQPGVELATPRLRVRSPTTTLPTPDVLDTWTAQRQMTLTQCTTVQVINVADHPSSPWTNEWCDTNIDNNIDTANKSTSIVLGNWHRRRRRGPGWGHVPPKIRENIFCAIIMKNSGIFSGKNHVKFEKFVNFSGKYH